MIEYIFPKYNGSEWVYNIRTAENLKEAKRYVLENVGATAFNWRPCDCEPNEKWQYCDLGKEDIHNTLRIMRQMEKVVENRTTQFI